MGLVTRERIGWQAFAVGARDSSTDLWTDDMPYGQLPIGTA